MRISIPQLCDELRKKIESSVDARELEDLYLPYRPKRRTRATAAKEAGLVRSEGKEYVVADGDIVLFRFNV